MYSGCKYDLSNQLLQGWRNGSIDLHPLSCVFLKNTLSITLSSEQHLYNWFQNYVEDPTD